MSLHSRDASTPIFTHLAVAAWGFVALLIFANVATRTNNFAAIIGERYKIPKPEHPSQAQSLPTAAPEHDIRPEAQRAAQPKAETALHVQEAISPVQAGVEAAPEFVGTVIKPGTEAAPDVPGVAPAQRGAEPAHEVLETIAPAEPPVRPAPKISGATAKADAKRKKKPDEQPVHNQQPIGGDRPSITNY
jgi:hypothetical protein